MLNQKITQWVVEKLSQVPFKKGIHNNFGNLILKRPKIVQFLPLVGFIFGIIPLCASIFTNIYSADEKLQCLTILVPTVIVLGIINITFAISKTLIDNDGITTYRLYGKRHLDFNSIVSVEYTKMYMGCVLLKGTGIKLLVPLDTYGFSEFHEILKSKLGFEKCILIENEMKNRRKLLENYKYS